jgi:MFS family permease
MTNEFRQLSDIAWYESAYLVTTTALQPTCGKLYQNFQAKYVYVTAMVIFEAGSLICGVARNSHTFVVGRSIAGLGAAGITSGVLTIIAHSVPLPRRPMFNACIGSIYAVDRMYVFADIDRKLCWSNSRWGVDRARHMEMVLFYEHAHWRADRHWGDNAATNS